MMNYDIIIMLFIYCFIQVIFPRPVEKQCAKYPSGITHTLVLAGALEDYTKLNMKILPGL